ncbi:NADH dehydrogenase [ubiquinone] 1 beta subcomplex subunit 7 [Trichinella pseudospiralis]|uniref:NADH dehydrogenase [ubiquinone] 1 beta subcomplex subunit 7 n=1 Tax=Trichinella pseudospiralis TaxID=6337 RepID=A0A0V1FND4_TRIPS|nr:NADH dehydrogenase [ubiquinone] 1 beta subcomplex subunit 7 [Trichinella pseudospiralis]
MQMSFYASLHFKLITSILNIITLKLLINNPEKISKIAPHFSAWKFTMGQWWSSAYEGWMDPSIRPDRYRPPLFDPLYGFPRGRKKRQMIATDEEMDAWQLEYRDRDYCAHFYINHLRCLDNNRPFAYWNCKHERHELTKCEWEDMVLRVKEFERERRLLKKEKILKEKQAAAAAAQLI